MAGSARAWAPEMRTYRTGLLTLCVALATSTAAAVAANPTVAGPQVHAVELAIEAPADGLILPASAPGNVVVTRCTGCAPVSVLATARSRYFVGKVQVSLDELRRVVSGQPNASVVVLYDGKSRELTRILASAEASGPPRPGRK
jgi:hypothetical protein